ncbi:MAG: DUF5069 domain-containing protein [Verrucomicrobiota bacterium]|jgi:hypothetical protein|nr:hypothetical protein [Verrucomicrobiales bacterium]MEC8691774.1 DUF5069 domain-containing protein [Verrucomicrobiota bacterium]|tara:strand:+ start:643 stop:1170 length:528 start_codon:yes stop_codon:yes gene_type:complete
MAEQFSWDIKFKELFQKYSEKYKSGNREIDQFFEEVDFDFFDNIGYKPREFFDFIEDHCDVGAPSPETALLIAAVRRDYFLVMQKRQISENQITPTDLPPREEQLEEISWLPRIIMKAKAKLRGELHPDIMFCCQGDMNFLANHDIHPADFLRVVWASNDDDQKVADYVKHKQLS